MCVLKTTAMSVALAAGAVLLSTASVSALPLGFSAGGIELATRLDESSPLIDVRYRRGGRIGGGFGAGLGVGLLLGGFIASQPSYYYPGYPPYAYYTPAYPMYGPYYTPAYPMYGPYPPGDPAIAYCMRRFRSYDPYTMTYLGYDGFRHPCP